MDRCTYSRDRIEQLMPVIWDPHYTASDPDVQREAEMQGFKGTTDPRRVSDPWAERADIQRAWKLAPLTKRQRQVLYLRFGWGDLLEDIAHTLELASKGTVGEHLDRGLACIEGFLNGTEVAA